MSEENLGRNEPCHCGSGKKFKRCHGVNAAPKLTAPKAQPQMPPGMAGMDPSQFDPAMVQQMSQMVQRLPRAQLQKFQALMQKAMAGHDVSQEAEALEKTLPPDFQEMMKQFSSQMPAGGADLAGPEGAAPGEMTEEEARRIVELAAEEGKLSNTEAAEVLEGGPKTQKPAWKKLFGK